MSTSFACAGGPETNKLSPFVIQRHSGLKEAGGRVESALGVILARIMLASDNLNGRGFGGYCSAAADGGGAQSPVQASCLAHTKFRSWLHMEVRRLRQLKGQ